MLSLASFLQQLIIRLMIAKALNYKTFNWLSGCALLIAVTLSLPIFVVSSSVFSGLGPTWVHLADTVLSDYVSNSFLLLLGVAAGTLLLGVPAAWFTSVCEFRGKVLLTWMFLLPLAFPAYIVAYTYTGLLDFAGPVQSFIREFSGLKYGEYWFFEIRSLPGAAIMLTLVLYPYVYLLTRAAFLQQSTNSLEVCRTLGYSRYRAFFHLSLPMARPAIIAGLTLALMETLADYGTVQFFGISTFTTGIFRTFYGLGDSTAAAQLASLLLSFVAMLIILERYSRRQNRYHSNSEQRAAPALIKLSKTNTCYVWLICFSPILFGFLLPAAVLLYWSVCEAVFEASAFFSLAWNSFYLAISAAVIAVLLSLLLAYARRLKSNPLVNSAVTISGLGYALPGTIIAIGILIPLAWLDHRLIDLFESFFDIEIGLLLSGSLFALLFAYTVRFLAVSMGAVQTGLDKIKPNIDNAARSLGNNNLKVLQLVHVPLMRSSLLTALLIVFVDVLKEFPATLILRPFNFNTLAVHAFELASDERLMDAAPASLMIVAVGLLPVILLSRSISKRPAMSVSKGIKQQ
ncbi:MAG: ABC-type Fe3+ transport system, permease component [Osedax symbiont Rs2]|nr:MAG: ABC-type Fe3+ transport system, permease component [Osedax symbiont Rs2]